MPVTYLRLTPRLANFYEFYAERRCGGCKKVICFNLFNRLIRQAANLFGKLKDAAPQRTEPNEIRILWWSCQNARVPEEEKKQESETESEREQRPFVFDRQQPSSRALRPIYDEL